MGLEGRSLNFIPERMESDGEHSFSLEVDHGDPTASSEKLRL